MFPEPIEFRLIGYLTETSWTLKSKSNMLTAKTNSQTYWQRAVSHAMNGIIFSICSYQHLQLCQLPWNNSKRMQKRNRRRENCGKVETTLNLVSHTAASSSTAPSSSASNRPGILRAPGQQGSKLIAKGAGKLAAGGSNQNDAASSSQVWLSDAKTNDSATKLAASGTNQALGFQESTRKLAAENFKSSSTTTRSGRTTTTYLVLTFHTPRKFTRICDNNIIASQKTKWKTSMWIRWYGECPWLSLSKPQFILETMIWRIYIQPKINHNHQWNNCSMWQRS